MMNLYCAVILAVVVVSCQGCSWFTNPKEQPVIEDKLGAKIGTLATTPERRVVIFDRTTGKFCAEPPADAAENLASSFASALEGSDGTVTAKAELARTFASSSKQLFHRSQGVQLYRDGMYSLCQAFINGAISVADFKAEQDQLITESSKLIEQEIPYLKYFTIDNVQVPAISAPPQLGGSDDGTGKK